MKTQFVKIVIMTKVLKRECVKTTMANRRIQLNGENKKHADVALKRNMV